jgi:hypothetical protein
MVNVLDTLSVETHNVIWAECHNTEMLSVNTISVVWQNVIILNFGMLSVITHCAMLNNT